MNIKKYSIFSYKMEYKQDNSSNNLSIHDKIRQWYQGLHYESAYCMFEAIKTEQLTNTGIPINTPLKEYEVALEGYKEHQSYKDCEIYGIKFIVNDCYKLCNGDNGEKELKYIGECKYQKIYDKKITKYEIDEAKIEYDKLNDFEKNNLIVYFYKEIKEIKEIIPNENIIKSWNKFNKNELINLFDIFNKL